MNTYIFYIAYTDGYTDEFEVVAPTHWIAMEIVANEYEIDMDEVAYVNIELKRRAKMIKTYTVYPKGDSELRYEIKAPTKRVAKWCGLNVIQSNYCCNYTVKDMVVERKSNK